MHDLMDKMRRLSEASPKEAGPSAEAKLRAAFCAQRPKRNFQWLYIAAAAACVLFALITFVHKPAAMPPTLSIQLSRDFVPLPYADSGVPLEYAVVVRMNLRPEDLSSMGVAVPAVTQSATYKADVLVGQDGVARAVRLLQ